MILKGKKSDGFVQISEDVQFTGNVLADQSYGLGKTYYVRNSGSDTVNSGLTSSVPFKTVAYAVSRATNFDRIIFLPATDYSAYLETVLPVLITQKGLKLLGTQTSEHTWGSPAIHTHAVTTLVQVNAHGVEIGNMSFHDQGAGCSLEIAKDADIWRTHVHDCFFGGNSTALYGIVLGNYTGSGIGEGHTVDAPTSIIERCQFYEYATAAVCFDGTESVIRDCYFNVNGSGAYGILCHQNTTSRGGGLIKRNKFLAVDATDAVGIKMSATPTAGYLMVDDNRFVNFADNDHCISVRTGLTGLNYLGITAIAIT